MYVIQNILIVAVINSINLFSNKIIQTPKFRYITFLEYNSPKKNTTHKQALVSRLLLGNETR